jgi:hypothetical protein
MKTRALAPLSLVLALALVGPLSAAGAATRPAVTSVSPLKAKVGQTLTVRGSGFVAGPRRNTVIFMSDYGPTVFVKASQATSTRLTVPLPPALEKGMRGYPANPRANRFQLRVVSREPARSFTPASKSPVISPAETTPPPPSDVDKDGIPDSEDPDNDNDFLEDALERSVKTDPRKKDTDGDSLEDGWEYHSARDLNMKAVPYPGERPFPNALDPSDGNVDYDGDFLRSGEEHALWKATGRAFDASRLSNGVEDSPLGYSDGTQTSRREQAPAVPAFQRDAELYDARWEEPDYPNFLSRDGANADDAWSDDERDADRDGLSNITEGHMEMSRSTWNAWLSKCKDPDVKPWEDTEEGAYYGSFGVRHFSEPEMLNKDSDGDTLLDAEDDQDNDDVPNYSEMDFRCKDDPVTVDHDNDPATDEVLNPDYEPNVHPYNPCAPHGGHWVPYPGVTMSRSCPFYKPLGG